MRRARGARSIGAICRLRLEVSRSKQKVKARPPWAAAASINNDDCLLKKHIGAVLVQVRQYQYCNILVPGKMRITAALTREARAAVGRETNR